MRGDKFAFVTVKMHKVLKTYLTEVKKSGIYGLSRGQRHLRYYQANYKKDSEVILVSAAAADLCPIIMALAYYTIVSEL